MFRGRSSQGQDLFPDSSTQSDNPLSARTSTVSQQLQLEASPQQEEDTPLLTYTATAKLLYQIGSSGMMAPDGSPLEGDSLEAMSLEGDAGSERSHMPSEDAAPLTTAKASQQSKPTQKAKGKGAAAAARKGAAAKGLPPTRISRRVRRDGRPPLSRLPPRAAADTNADVAPWMSSSGQRTNNSSSTFVARMTPRRRNSTMSSSMVVIDPPSAPSATEMDSGVHFASQEEMSFLGRDSSMAAHMRSKPRMDETTRLRRRFMDSQAALKNPSASREASAAATATPGNGTPARVFSSAHRLRRRQQKTAELLTASPLRAIHMGKFKKIRLGRAAHSSSAATAATSRSASLYRSVFADISDDSDEEDNMVRVAPKSSVKWRYLFGCYNPAQLFPEQPQTPQARQLSASAAAMGHLSPHAEQTYMGLLPPSVAGTGQLEGAPGFSAGHTFIASPLIVSDKVGSYPSTEGGGSPSASPVFSADGALALGGFHKRSPRSSLSSPQVGFSSPGIDVPSLTAMGQLRRSSNSFQAPFPPLATPASEASRGSVQLILPNDMAIPEACTSPTMELTPPQGKKASSTKRYKRSSTVKRKPKKKKQKQKPKNPVREPTPPPIVKTLLPVRRVGDAAAAVAAAQQMRDNASTILPRSTPLNRRFSLSSSRQQSPFLADALRMNPSSSAELYLYPVRTPGSYGQSSSAAHSQTPLVAASAAADSAHRRGHNIRCGTFMATGELQRGGHCAVRHIVLTARMLQDALNALRRALEGNETTAVNGGQGEAAADCSHFCSQEDSVRRSGDSNDETISNAFSSLDSVFHMTEPQARSNNNQSRNSEGWKRDLSPEIPRHRRYTAAVLFSEEEQQKLIAGGKGQEWQHGSNSPDPSESIPFSESSRQMVEEKQGAASKKGLSAFAAAGARILSCNSLDTHDGNVFAQHRDPLTLTSSRSTAAHGGVGVGSSDFINYHPFQTSGDGALCKGNGSSTQWNFQVEDNFLSTLRDELARTFLPQSDNTGADGNNKEQLGPGDGLIGTLSDAEAKGFYLTLPVVGVQVQCLLHEDKVENVASAADCGSNPRRDSGVEDVNVASSVIQRPSISAVVSSALSFPPSPPPVPLADASGGSSTPSLPSAAPQKTRRDSDTPPHTDLYDYHPDTPILHLSLAFPYIREGNVRSLWAKHSVHATCLEQELVVRSIIKSVLERLLVLHKTLGRTHGSVKSTNIFSTMHAEEATAAASSALGSGDNEQVDEEEVGAPGADARGEDSQSPDNSELGGRGCPSEFELTETGDAIADAVRQAASSHSTSKFRRRRLLAAQVPCGPSGEQDKSRSGHGLSRSIMLAVVNGDDDDGAEPHGRATSPAPHHSKTRTTEKDCASSNASTAFLDPEQWSRSVVLVDDLFPRLEWAILSAIARSALLSKNNSSNNLYSEDRVKDVLNALQGQSSRLDLFHLEEAELPPAPECISPDVPPRGFTADRAVPFRWTPNTIAPRPFITEATDVWQVGMLAVELAEGSFPSWLKQQHVPLPALKQTSWSSRFNVFVGRCLHERPRDRPSVQQLLDDPWFSATLYLGPDGTHVCAANSPLPEGHLALVRGVTGATGVSRWRRSSPMMMQVAAGPNSLSRVPPPSSKGIKAGPSLRRGTADAAVSCFTGSMDLLEAFHSSASRHQALVARDAAPGSTPPQSSRRATWSARHSLRTFRSSVVMGPDESATGWNRTGFANEESSVHQQHLRDVTKVTDPIVTVLNVGGSRGTSPRALRGGAVSTSWNADTANHPTNSARLQSRILNTSSASWSTSGRSTHGNMDMRTGGGHALRSDGDEDAIPTLSATLRGGSPASAELLASVPAATNNTILLSPGVEDRLLWSPQVRNSALHPSSSSTRFATRTSVVGLFTVAADGCAAKAETERLTSNVPLDASAEDIAERVEHQLSNVVQAFMNLSDACPIAAKLFMVLLLQRMAKDPQTSARVAPLQSILFPVGEEPLCALDEPQHTSPAVQAAGSSPAATDSSPSAFHAFETCKWVTAARRVLDKEAVRMSAETVPREKTQW